eukprot:TRINITY_DN8207_c0_g1_i1.p1 TRINITY_DN8207_c0_g1~~TRINITY_DN8207_c0_g1_i1.p1  ORF type:complete len:288 (-),score=99.64 TRINITY_DN8207_c0_g1_i1:142-1005(-)
MTWIATQHPTEATVGDFWKMVLHEKPCAVLMLNKLEHDKESEHGHPQDPLNPLVTYFPESPCTSPGLPPARAVQHTAPRRREVLYAGATQHSVVQVERTAAVRHQVPGGAEIKRAQLRIRLLRGTPEGGYVTQAAEHTVEHITVDFWQDQDVISAAAFKALYMAIQAAEEQAAPGRNKLVVHCTGGMGRTGTFITVDLAARALLRQMDTGSEQQGVSIDQIISSLRSRRGSMVQHEAQYLMCHEATAELSAMMASQEALQPLQVLEPLQAACAEEQMLCADPMMLDD